MVSKRGWGVLISGRALFIRQIRYATYFTGINEQINDSRVSKDFSSCFRTPLVRLNKLSQETGCEILVKAEFANGGGSVKDRAALFLIKDSEAKGE